MPRKVVAAGALVTSADGRVLVVRPTYKPGWEIPGGCVEDGESARDACARELLEELGIPLPVGRLLVLEHQTAQDDKGDSLMLVYDVTVAADPERLRLASEELAEARFVAPDALSEHLPLRQARRLTAAVRAK